MSVLKHALKIFAQVCESGSFTKAAARLYITPSAVMQQMDALEREYGVTLLSRSHHGVRPTEAGAYLRDEIEVLQRRSEAVRVRLNIIAAGDGVVCVGTSLLEKCRLLYDLWTLYSQKEPNCRIQMVNINHESGIPDCADLIESLNSGIGWMREWTFDEICQVPIGIALEDAHPLAQKAMLTPGDLAGQTLVTFRDTVYEGLAQLHALLDEVGAQVLWQDMPSPSVFWECAFHHRLLLAPLCWDDILPGLTLRPVRWDFALPYGIFSRPRPRDEASRFLRFIRETYAGDNPNDVVPALNY